MTNKITPDGFFKQRYQELREFTSQDYKDSLGSDIKTDRSSVLGQLISIDTQAEDEIASLIQELLSAFNPVQASGNLLSSLAKIFGTNRLAGTRSSISLTVVVNKPTLIREGFTVKNADGVRFHTTTDINLPTGSHIIFVESIDYGAFASPAGTVTSIATPVFGVVSVVNIQDGVLGNERETDAQLRQRLLSGSQRPSQTITGVNKAIDGVPGILKFKVIENRSPLTLPSGQLPHSLFIIIDGGDDLKIAEALIDTGVPAGIDYSLPTGVVATTSTYTDTITGQVYDAIYARPVPTDLFVQVDINVNASYDTNDSATIRNDIIAHYANVRHLGGVIFSSELYCPVADATSDIISVSSITIGGDLLTLSTSFDLGYVGSVAIQGANIIINPVVI